MPKAKLTKRLLDASEPKTTEYELRDTEITGFLCKVSPSGRKTYMLQYRNADGRRRKPAIGLVGELTVDQARNIAQRWLSEVREGKDPSQRKKERRRSVTVREFARLYLEKQLFVRVKPSTYKMYEFHMKKYIIPQIGDLKVDAFAKRDMKMFIEHYSSIPGAAYISRNFLHGMFTWAENCGVREEDTHPCKGVPLPLKSKKPRLRTY